MLCVPLTASVPDHAPEAVHLVALVEDQISVVLLCCATKLGFALIDMIGGAEDGGLGAVVPLDEGAGIPLDGGALPLEQATKAATTPQTNTSRKIETNADLPIVPNGWPTLEPIK